MGNLSGKDEFKVGSYSNYNFNVNNSRIIKSRAIDLKTSQNFKSKNERSFKEILIKTNIATVNDKGGNHVKKSIVNVFKFKHKDLEPFEINNVNYFLNLRSNSNLLLKMQNGLRNMKITITIKYLTR